MQIYLILYAFRCHQAIGRAVMVPLALRYVIVLRAGGADIPPKLAFVFILSNAL